MGPVGIRVMHPTLSLLLANRSPMLEGHGYRKYGTSVPAQFYLRGPRRRRRPNGSGLVRLHSGAGPCTQPYRLPKRDADPFPNPPRPGRGGSRPSCSRSRQRKNGRGIARRSAPLYATLFPFPVQSCPAVDHDCGPSYTTRANSHSSCRGLVRGRAWGALASARSSASAEPASAPAPWERITLSRAAKTSSFGPVILCSSQSYTPAPWRGYPFSRRRALVNRATLVNR